MKSTKTLLTKLDETPPFVAYALARRPDRKHPRPTLAEFVKDSGLSQSTFLRIAKRETWAGIKAGDIEKFCRGCRVNLLYMHKHRDFVAHTFKHPRPFSHLPENRVRKFIKKWQEYEARKNGGDAA